MGFVPLVASSVLLLNHCGAMLLPVCMSKVIGEHLFGFRFGSAEAKAS